MILKVSICRGDLLVLVDLNEYSRIFLFLEWEYVYMAICGFKCKMFNWIIIESEKRCILGIYFVSRINYFVLVDQIWIWQWF